MGEVTACRLSPRALLRGVECAFGTLDLLRTPPGGHSAAALGGIGVAYRAAMAPGDIASLASAVRSGTVRAVDLVDEALRRIEVHDGALNAVVARCDDEAHHAAAEVDAAVASGRDPGPLAGVPVLVKDLEDVGGMVTTQGSALLADAAPASAPRHGPASGWRTPAPSSSASRTCRSSPPRGTPTTCVFGVTAQPVAPATTHRVVPAVAVRAAVASGHGADRDGDRRRRLDPHPGGLLRAGRSSSRRTGVIGRWPAPDWIDMSTEGPLATSVDDLALLWQVEVGAVDGDPAALCRRSLRESAAPRPVRRVVRGGPFRVAVWRYRTTSASRFERAVRQMADLAGRRRRRPYHGGGPVRRHRRRRRLVHQWPRLSTSPASGDSGWSSTSTACTRRPAASWSGGWASTLDDYLAARRRRF